MDHGVPLGKMPPLLEGQMSAKANRGRSLCVAIWLGFALAGSSHAQRATPAGPRRRPIVDVPLVTDSLEVQALRALNPTRTDTVSAKGPSAMHIIGGAVLGGGVGLVLGYALAPRSHCPDCGVASWKVERADFWGAGLGIVAGGTVGWLLSDRH